MVLDAAALEVMLLMYAEPAVEIESGGIHQVKPWFEGRLDFGPVRDFPGDEEIRLAGGPFGYFLDRKAVVLIFRQRLHLVTAFVFRAQGLPWPYLPTRALGRVRATVSQSRAFNTVVYRGGDLGYALTCDVDSQTRARLAPKKFQRALSRVTPGLVARG